MRLFSLRKFGYFLTILTSVLFGLFGAVQSWALEVPLTYLTYAGRLVDNDGVPVTSSTVDMVFKLYTASSGGTCLWSNSSTSCATQNERAVTLTEGLFSENFGAGTYAEINSAVFADDNTVYLEVVVEGETLSPRKLLTAAPYAVNSNMLRGLTPDFSVGEEEILATDGAGKLAIIGATGIDGTNTNAAFRIDVSSADASSMTDMIFAVTLDGAATTPFAVGPDGVILENSIYFTQAASINSDATMTLYPEDEGVQILVSDDDVDEMLAVDFTLSPTLAVSQAVDGINVNLSTGFALDPGGNALTGLDVVVGNGGMGQTYGAYFSGAADTGVAIATTGTYGLQLSGFSGAGIRFESNGTSISTDMSIPVTIDPGSAGDFIFNADDESNFQIDLAAVGTSTTSLNIASIAASSATDWGSATHVQGLVIDLDTNIDSDSVTLMTGLYIGGDTDTGSTIGIKIDEADRGIWFTGTIAEDIYADEDFTIATSSDTTAVVIDPGGSSGGLVTTYFGNNVGDGSDAHVDIVSDTADVGNMLRIQRQEGSVDFDGTGLYIDIAETSATSDAIGLYVYNAAGGNATAIEAAQTQLSQPILRLFALPTDATTSNTIQVYSNAGGDTEFRVTNNGNAFVDGSFTGAGADYAEYFESSDHSLGDYQVACLDPNNDQGVKKCAAGSREVVGVISTNPGFIGNNIGGADGSLEDNAAYRLVGMVGQIETDVTAADGPIAIGDAVTASVFSAGYAGRANGQGYILGRALEPLLAGTGRIRVLVQPMWWAGDMFTDEGDVFGVAKSLELGSALASAENTAVNSRAVSFIGSVWGEGVANDVGVSQELIVRGEGDYALAWSALDGSPLMQLQEDGDLLVTGRIFPGNRGVAQDEAYIYYDAAGGGYMKTNAAGWSVGSYDFAETYAAAEVLEPGEVVEFSEVPGEVKRSVGVPYSERLVGIVSTRPGFLAGDLTEGNYPIALSGRVPARVSVENGEVRVGDPLTTSSKPGMLMKATAPGPVAGYALESLSGEGVVMVFVRPTYFGGSEEGVVGEGASTNLDQLEVSGNLLMLGGRLQGIGQLIGLNGWSIAEDGTIMTEGEIKQVTVGHGGNRVTTTVPGAPQRTVTLSGTTVLQNGLAHVELKDVWPEYAQVVSPTDLPRVVVTPYELVASLAVVDREVTSFSIVSAGGESGVMVDWYLVAPHKDETSPWTVVDIEPEGEDEGAEPVVDVALDEGLDVLEGEEVTPEVEVDTNVVEEDIQEESVQAEVETEVIEVVEELPE